MHARPRALYYLNHFCISINFWHIHFQVKISLKPTVNKKSWPFIQLDRVSHCEGSSPNQVLLRFLLLSFVLLLLYPLVYPYFVYFVILQTGKNHFLFVTPLQSRLVFSMELFIRKVKIKSVSAKWIVHCIYGPQIKCV